MGVMKELKLSVYLFRKGKENAPADTKNPKTKPGLRGKGHKIDMCEDQCSVLQQYYIIRK